MEEFNIENIEKYGTLLYKNIRGSVAYGLNIDTSDIDTSGVFVLSKDLFYGLKSKQVEQIQDEKGDNVYYEIDKYIELLSKGNPTMIESLFVPESCICYMHPVFKILRDNRDVFITKQLIKSTFCYAKEQIAKARGLNKKIVNPMTRRKHMVEFCFTFKNQGSQSFDNFLKSHGLKQRYCGLVHVPNWDNTYGVYYDWGNHILNECKISDIGEYQIENVLLDYAIEYFDIPDRETAFNFLIEKIKPIGYRGAYDEMDEKTTQLRLSSVAEGAKPICHIQFNENGFKQHCVKWKEYQEWVEKRNPQRFNENKDKEFDRKNMMHCTRLLNMGIEIAKTGQINVDRTNIDRDFLLNIRLGNTTYDEIIDHVVKKQEELDEAINNCTLPTHCDMNRVNELLIQIHKAIYGENYVYLTEEGKPDCNKCGDYEYCAFHYDECTGFIPGDSSYLNEENKYE